MDIPDGSVFKEHPAFGRNPLLNKPGAPIQLGAIISYDDVTFNNPLGFARGHNKLGIVTFTLVNLDLSVRNNLEYIMPICIFNHSHVPKYGMTMLFSGADKHTGCIQPNQESSPGGQLREFDKGIQLSAPHTQTGFAPRQFKMHLLAIVADFPAAQCLTPHMESVSTRSPSRNSNWDTNDPHAHKASSYVRSGTWVHDGKAQRIANRWKVRTLAQTTAHLETLKKKTPTSRKSEMQRWGYNKLVYAVQPSLLPGFDYTKCMPEDPMHCDPDGNGRCQGYYTIYMLGQKGVGFERINERIDAYSSWLPGQKPPHLHPSIAKGAKGGKPTPGGKWRYSASQTMHFISHSVELLEPLVPDTSAPFWVCHLKYVELHELAFRYQFTEAQRIHLDELIYEYSMLFDAVREYDGCKMPKHQFQQLYPVQIQRFGPLRNLWTMRFEAWYQVGKRIAEASNFKEAEKRILEVYSLRSGRTIASGRLAHLGDTVPMYAGPALPVDGVTKVSLPLSL